MQSRPVAVLAIAAVGALALTWDSLQAQKPTEVAAPVEFTRDIQPILQANCYECHGPKRRGDTCASTRAPRR